MARKSTIEALLQNAYQRKILSTEGKNGRPDNEPEEKRGSWDY